MREQTLIGYTRVRTRVTRAINFINYFGRRVIWLATVQGVQGNGKPLNAVNKNLIIIICRFNIQKILHASIVWLRY